MAQRKVPLVLQMEAVECGAACLAMILARFGHYAPLGEVRESCGVSRDGVSAKGIVIAARRYGLKPRARRVEPEDLAKQDGPSIIHWEMNHFVVLERWTPTTVHLMDPAVGRRIVTAEDFSTSFTGICIDFEPTDDFVPRKRQRLSVKRYLAMLSGSWGALAMILAMTVVLNLLGLALPLVTKVTLDQVLLQQRVGWLPLIALSAIALLVTHAFFSFLRGWVLAAMQRFLDYAMSTYFVRHLLSLPLAFFQQRSTGDLLSRIQSTKTIREVLTGQSIALLVDGLLLLTYLALMLYTDMRLGLVVVAAGVAQTVLFFVARPIQLRKLQELEVRQVRESSHLVQMLQGVLTLKCSGNESSSHQQWLNLHIGTLNGELREALVTDVVRAIMMLIRGVVPVVVLVVGGHHVLAGTLSVGALIAFQMLQHGFLNPLNQILGALLSAQILPVLITRMDDILESKPDEVSDRPAPHLTGQVEFENVSFQYHPNNPLVLDDISFTVPKGAKVALVGPSGSGKSTVARLLMGFYQATGGRILLDGRDMREWDPDSIRRQTGVVLQETVLFHGTIRENLSLYNSNAPLEDVINAARVAQIHDDIQALPMGYDSEVSGSGGTFSGGQRQRLALARAILHHPPIIILDEATSALDTVTEAAIHHYFTLRRCTRIVIAHRLSTIRDADLILVIDGGKIVEQGQHDTLMAEGGLYADLIAKGETKPVEPEAPAPEPVNLIPVGSLFSYPVLSEFSPDDLGALAKQLQRSTFDPEDTIINQHDKPAGLFFVEEGKVDIQITTPGLPPYTAATLPPGSIFGEISLLDGSVSSASAVAAETSRVLCLPYHEFQQLSGKRDVLAQRMLLSLGRVVSDRIHELTEKQREAMDRASVYGFAALSASPKAERQVPQRALALGETPFGASFTDAELRFLRDIGTMTHHEEGALLFREGDPSEFIYVLLAGRIGVEAEGISGFHTVLRPGALFGEVNFFDRGPRSATCSALRPSTVFSLPIDTVHRLLDGHNPVMWKVLKKLIHAIVWHFRLENIRLHDTVAEGEDAAAEAFEARERAMAQEQVTGGLDTLSAEQPVVTGEQSELSAAACLTWILRYYQRPIALQSVAEAYDEAAGTAPTSLAEAARLFGFNCRKMDLSHKELGHIDAPLVLGVGEGHYVVAKAWRRGRLYAMDPAEGHVEFPAEEVRKAAIGECYEILPDKGRGESRTPVRRLLQFFGERWRALAILFLASVLVQLAGLVAPLILGAMVDTVLPSHDIGLLHAMGIAIGAMAIFQFALNLTRDSAVRFIGTHFDRDALDQLVAHVLRLPISFFERHRPAEILERFASFGVLRDLLTNQGLVTLLDLGSVAIAMFTLFSLAPTLGLAVTLIVIVHLVALALLVRPLSRLASEEIDRSAAQQDNMIEVLNGITTLRATGSPTRALQHWIPSFKRELATHFSQQRLNAVSMPGLDFLRDAGLAMVILWGAWRVLQGNFQIGTLIAMQGVAASGLLAVSGLVGHLFAYTRGAIHLRNIRELFGEKPEQESELLISPGKLRGQISVEHVSFRYAPDSPLVLDDVWLSVRSGMKVAIVGKSGSGKSTLGKLLVGAYVPTSGQILFDGKDTTHVDLGALRRQVGVVLQNTFLFGSSIRENLTLSAPHATLSDIQEAARKAAIAEDIESLPMKYDTILGEGGGTFSGGQRQRLAIARALINDPAILLLDEATSALDNLSQAAVEQSLSQTGCTRIVIAHRLTTVMDADVIVVLEAGRVVETGTHEELLKRKGAYAKLAEAQTL